MYCRRLTKLSLQIENGRRRQCPRANTNSAIFQELEKGDVARMKGYVTNGQPIAGDTVCGVPLEAVNYEPSAIRG